MSVLGVEYGCPYVLEGPDGTRVVFNDDADEDFIGVLSPESSGLDSADVREDANDAVEEDGGHHGDFYEGRRPVVLQGTIIASGAVDRNEKISKLKVASRALRSDAILTWETQGGPEVELKLRRQQPLRITKGYVKEFQLPLVAADIFPVGTTTHKKTSTNKGSDTGIKYPKVAENKTGHGAIAWLSPNNAKILDNNPADAAIGTSNWLLAKEFDFSSIGAGAKITGVELSFTRAAVNFGTEDDTIYLVMAGSVQTSGTNKAIAGSWGNAEYVTKTRGGLGDFWNLPITITDVKSTGFGVAISAVVT